MDSAPPLLDIILVVSGSDREYLRVCLESLERFPLTRGEMAIHVVDNATTDGTVQLVRDRFPHVHLHELGWNAGFCIGNNTALRQADGEFALVLNPDTEFIEPSLDHLVDVMRRRPEAGMIGCRLVRRDGSLDHAAKRSFPTPLAALAHFTGLGTRASAPERLAQYRAPHLDERDCGEVDAVNGAFMLVRRDAVEAVGLLDEGYWLYMEDLDWCYRFKQAGWKVWYEGTTTVIHVKGGTTVRRGHRGLRHNYYFHRGMVRFYRKFYARRRPIDLAVYAGIWAKFTVAATRSAIARRSVV
jgi:GT2 family glycosyltransferase